LEVGDQVLALAETNDVYRFKAASGAVSVLGYEEFARRLADREIAGSFGICTVSAKRLICML